MSVSRYACPNCGKEGNLPDFCCGQPMLPRGSYVCKNCGQRSSSPQSCCGQDMTRI